MAIFQISRGSSANLPSTITDGCVYWCTDTGMWYIDFADANGDLYRKQTNAKEAESLIGYSISIELNSSDAEIPTSKAVIDYVNGKIFVGTYAEYETANANNEIPINALVVITDDESSSGGSSSGGESSSTSTSSLLGTGALGYMILG